MKRIVPGLALAACWLLLLLHGSFLLFWAAVVLLAVIGGHEYVKMILVDEAPAPDRFILSFVLCLPVMLAGAWFEDGMNSGLFLAFFLSVLYILANYSRLQDTFSTLSKLCFGCLYVGFLTAHLLLLWQLPEGNYWLIILVAITAGSDSGAYYCGRKYGRHKLCRNVSPNKTIEGAVGGVVSAVAVALVFSYLLLQNVNWLIIIPVSILLTITGIIGDLCESIIKRGTNTKDSGKILLGHGGVLDRIDSMILAAPLLYYLHVFTG